MGNPEALVPSKDLSTVLSGAILGTGIIFDSKRNINANAVPDDSPVQDWNDGLFDGEKVVAAYIEAQKFRKR